VDDADKERHHHRIEVEQVGSPGHGKPQPQGQNQAEHRAGQRETGQPRLQGPHDEQPADEGRKGYQQGENAEPLQRHHRMLPVAFEPVVFFM
jgi:hypothetical protein